MTNALKSLMAVNNDRSQRRFSADEPPPPPPNTSPSPPLKNKWARHPRSHTLDTSSTVNKRRGSLLQRVFSVRVLRHRSPQLSGGSSTTTGVSRASFEPDDLLEFNADTTMAHTGSPQRPQHRLVAASDGNSSRTRRATMDMELINKGSSTSPAHTTPSSSTGGTNNTPNRLVALVRGMSYRRATMGDLKVGGNPASSTGNQQHAAAPAAPTSTRSQRKLAVLLEQDARYKEQQRLLQRRADDHAKGGELEAAIDVWIQSLLLAQENRDTITCQTEIMCTLLVLHLQTATTLPLEIVREAPSSSVSSLSLLDAGAVLAPLLTQEDLQKRNAYHQQAAKRYLVKIEPSLVQPSWLFPPTKDLLDFFLQQESWELALYLAETLLNEDGGGIMPPVVSTDQLAKLNYQVACRQLTLRRHGDALQHLQTAVQQLQLLDNKQQHNKKEGLLRDDHDNNKVLYVQVLQKLATEYTSYGQYELALDAMQEQLVYTEGKTTKASLYCQMATELYIPMGKLDVALEQLQLATTYLNERAVVESTTSAKKTEETAHDVQLQLLLTKADVLFRLGRSKESLQVYEKALAQVNAKLQHEATTTFSKRGGGVSASAAATATSTSAAADKAKILYTMGRLCVKLKRIRKAADFFEQELEITKTALGNNHLSVSRVLHELARLYDEGLGDYQKALGHYHATLKVESKVMMECQDAIRKCEKCNANNSTTTTTTTSVSARRACPMHATLHRDAALQIRETKKCQGRIHFKLGNFEKALETSFPGASPSAGRKVPSYAVEQ
jgi:tetratricopeptide (TPR) repeat protein